MDGILIISFGISDPNSREKTVDAFMEQIREEFSEIPVYLAFTNERILKKIYKDEKRSIDTVPEALKRMHIEEITRVFIQPTYIFNGMENKKMINSINYYKDLFPENIFIGKPLLANREDYHNLFSAFLSQIFFMEDQAIILLGHSGNQFANKIYANCKDYIKEKGYKNWYIGAVKEFSYIKIIEKELKRKRIKKIVLVPLIFSLEKHTLEEIAGEQENSWKSIFQQKGYEVECILKGIGEYEMVRKNYIEHLKQLIELESK